MNILHIISLITLFIFSLPLHANILSKNCIADPIFNEQVCIYKTPENPSKNKIFLIHGIGTNASQDWINQIEPLFEHFQVFTLDLPGFGDSSKGNKSYTPESYVELIEFISQQYKLERFDLVGHSLGAAISILYTAKHPEKINRLVTVDVAGILQRVAIGKYVASRLIYDNAFFTDKLESYVVKLVEKFETIYAYTEEKIGSNSEKIKAGIELVDYNFGPILDKVLTPTLIVWGQNDKISPIRTAKVLNHRLKNSQLKILADSGHTPMQDQPESFNKLIIQFLLSDNSLYEHTKDSFIEHKQEIANCNNMESFTLTGSYDRVNINNCNNAVIKNSKINELSIFESRVVIYDTEIGGDVHTALKTTGADVKITNSKISGDIAIKSDRSRLDLASVDFYPTITAIAGLGLSRIIFSVCRIYSGEKIKHVHQSAKVEYGSFR